MVSMCMLLHCFTQGLCKYVNFPVSHIRTLYNAHSYRYILFLTYTFKDNKNQFRTIDPLMQQCNMEPMGLSDFICHQSE